MENEQRKKFTPRDLDNALDRLKLMKFFPSDPGAQAALWELLGRICPHLEALEWLTFTLIDRVAEWPGAQAIRGLLCTKYDAADGVDAYCTIPGFRPEDGESRTIEAHQQWKSGGWVDSGDEQVRKLTASAEMPKIEGAKA